MLILASLDLETLPVWMELVTAWRTLGKTMTPLSGNDNAHDKGIIFKLGEPLDPNSLWRHIGRGCFKRHDRTAMMRHAGVTTGSL
jgi:hypothetical protein